MILVLESKLYKILLHITTIESKNTYDIHAKYHPYCA